MASERRRADRRELRPASHRPLRIVRFASSASHRPLRIVLFGSLARGEVGYDSDMDLLVVFDEVEWEKKRELTVEIMRSLVGLTVPVDIIVTDLDEIARRGDLVGTVLRPALREGEIVHERR